MIQFATFSGDFYEVTRQVYQGNSSSGTKLLDATRCYNGSCNYAITAPVSRIDYWTLPGGLDSSLAAHSGYYYNSFGLPTTIYENDYGSPGTATRITSISYANPGNGIVDRPSDISITDGAWNRFAETQISYDETALTSTSATPAPNHDYTNYGSSFTQRGNPTTVKRWVSSTTFLATTNAYDDLGNLRSTTDPGGHTTSFDYTDSYNDGVNHSTLAFPTTITLPATSVMGGSPQSHILYNQYYWPSAMLYKSIDQNSLATTYTYDSMWRTTNITRPDGGQTDYQYTTYQNLPDFNVAVQTDSSHWTSTWTQTDGLGRPIRTWDDNGGEAAGTWDEVDTCYNSSGQVSFVPYAYQSAGTGPRRCDPSTYAGDSYAYDALGRTTSVTHSDGTSVLTTYNGRAVQVQDEGNGSGSYVKHIYQHDGLGRTTTVCEVAGSIFGTTTGACGLDITGNPQGVTTSYSYDPLDNVTQIAQGSLTARKLAYDGLSHVIGEIIPEVNNNACTASDNNQYSLCYGYDSEGKLLTRTRPSANQPASCIGQAPPNNCTNSVTTYFYDQMHRLYRTDYADAASENTPNPVAFYDTPSNSGGVNGYNLGRMTSVALEDKTYSIAYLWTTFGYDQMGRTLVDEQSFHDTSWKSYYVNYTYNLAGQVTSLNVNNYFTLTNNYNVNGQTYQNSALRQVTSSLSDAAHPGTLLSNVHYGAFGLLTDRLGNGVAESYSYSSRGQMQSYVSTPYSYNLGYTPDSSIASSSDSVAELRLSSSMLSQSGLTAFNPSQIVDGDVTNYGWHTDSAVAGAWLQVDLGSGNAQAVTQVRVYPAYAGYAGNMPGNYNIQYSDDASTWVTVSSGFVPSQGGWNSQSWASAGAHRYWRLYLTNTPGPGPWLAELELVAQSTALNGNWTYSYDALNRISGANKSGGTNLTFDIDRDANRWHQNPNGAQISFDASTNHVASGNGVTYDAAGNIINDGVHTYTYDAEYRITQVDGGNTASYMYDPLGRRLRRTVNGTGYEDVYDGTNMVAEVRTSDGMWMRGEIYLGGRHLATYNFGGTYFSHTDWLDTERVRSDWNGNSVGSCTSNPYGDNYSCTGTDPSPIKYAGMEYDSESGLYHTHFRYYNPRLGLWMTPDPAGMGAANGADPQSLNRYAYAGGDPINRIDRLGLNAGCSDKQKGEGGSLRGCGDGARSPFGLGPWGPVTWVVDGTTVPFDNSGIDTGFELTPVDILQRASQPVALAVHLDDCPDCTYMVYGTIGEQTFELPAEPVYDLSILALAGGVSTLNLGSDQTGIVWGPYNQGACVAFGTNTPPPMHNDLCKTKGDKLIMAFQCDGPHSCCDKLIDQFTNDYLYGSRPDKYYFVRDVTTMQTYRSAQWCELSTPLPPAPSVPSKKKKKK